VLGQNSLSFEIFYRHKRFTNVDPEIGIRRVATSKDKDKLQKFGLYLNMYKEKWKRAVIKHEED
jgi:hypothetical protein